MEENYKGHHIHSTAKFVPDRRWTPHLLITSPNGAIHQFVLRGGFESESEAETYGIVFAKTWIDEGNPPNPPNIRDK
jgi:hypothetical protein